MSATTYTPQRKPVGFLEAALRGTAAQNVGPRVNLGPIFSALFPAARNAMADSDYQQAMQSQAASQAAQEMMKLMPAQTEQGLAQAGLGTATAQSGVRQIPSAEAANIAQHRLGQIQAESGSRLVPSFEKMTGMQYDLGAERAKTEQGLLPSFASKTLATDRNITSQANAGTKAYEEFARTGQTVPGSAGDVVITSPESLPWFGQTMQLNQQPKAFEQQQNLYASQIQNEELGRKATQQGMNIRGEEQAFRTTPVNIPGMGVLQPQMFDMLSHAQQIQNQSAFQKDTAMSDMMKSAFSGMTPEQVAVGMGMLKSRYPEVMKFLPQAATGPKPGAVQTGIQAARDAMSAGQRPQTPVNTAPSAAAPSPVSPQVAPPIAASPTSPSGTPFPAYDIKQSPLGQSLKAGMPTGKPGTPTVFNFPAMWEKLKGGMSNPHHVAPEIPPPSIETNAPPAVIQPPAAFGPQLPPTSMNDAAQQYLSPMQPMLSTRDVMAMIQQLLAQG